MTENEKKRRLIFLSLVFLLLVPALVFYLVLKKTEAPDEMPLAEIEGKLHHGWSLFYHAQDGEWRMLDEACYVLNERKYVSSENERERYLVHRVVSGGVLRIISSQGRWKEVEVLDEDGSAQARGWIDADPIRKVERLDPGINEQH